MIVVTGGAGLIGSNIIRNLNAEGICDIILVDRLRNKGKWKNLVDLNYDRFMDKSDFLKELPSMKNIDVIFHMGACSNTMEEDADYLMKNNFEYSRQVALESFEKDIRLIYASSAASYGSGEHGYDDEGDIDQLRPLNIYGYSKQLFDQWLKRNNYDKKVVALKYFNVFGPYEFHKGSMQSLVLKAYEQIKKEGRLKLFKSYRDAYKDGEQKRDFIYVKNAVAMTRYFMDKVNENGIFNIGSGEARTWNELAAAIFKAMKKDVRIDYIEMPEHLKKQYQYFTEAKMEKFSRTDFKQNTLLSFEESVEDYIHFLDLNHSL